MTGTEDTIKNHITGLQRGIGDLSKETKTNAAVIIIVTSGFVTVGKSMWSAYTAIAPIVASSTSVSGFVGAVITAAGGMTVVGAATAAIAIAAGILWALLKKSVG